MYQVYFLESGKTQEFFIWLQFKGHCKNTLYFFYLFQIAKLFFSLKSVFYRFLRAHSLIGAGVFLAWDSERTRGGP